MVVRPQQGGRDDEQGARGAAGNQHIVDVQSRRAFQNQLAQPFAAAMLAIEKRKIGNGQAQGAERLVGARAFGQIIRSEERSVGKGCAREGKSQWSRYTS